MKADLIEKEIREAISNFDKSLIPEELTKVDSFYNYLQEKGMLKRRESQLFPNEAYSFRTQSGHVQ